MNFKFHSISHFYCICLLIVAVYFFPHFSTLCLYLCLCLYLSLRFTMITVTAKASLVTPPKNEAAPINENTPGSIQAQ